MRILKLTPALEKNLLRARRERDRKAERIAAKIIADVRRRGDAALFAYARKFDGINLHRESVWVSTDGANVAPATDRSAARLGRRPISTESRQSATSQISHDFLRAVQHAAHNIRLVAEKQLPQPWTLAVESGVSISQRVSPIDSIGCYIPGGRFSLVSTLLMIVIPAQVAGIPRITVVCPKPNAELLAAAKFLGIKQIARIGGAQAIAALAYGTKSIFRVDKIFGPGNRFVTAAKQLVSADCAIDLPAGPTEAVVLAEHGNACWIAADLLAQAEHAPDAGCFLVTTSRILAQAVQTEIKLQLAQLPPDNPAHISTRKTGAILLAPSLAAAHEFTNGFAPEHLSLPSSLDNIKLQEVSAAGTIFLGSLAAQPFGDYIAGSNHVLPTGGWARTRGGLSTADFVKCVNVQMFTDEGFDNLSSDAMQLARAEGLHAHANAIQVRMSKPVRVKLAQATAYSKLANKNRRANSLAQRSYKRHRKGAR